MTDGERPTSDVYRSAGVDYNLLDSGKRSAIAAARSTSTAVADYGLLVDEASRGEPVFTFSVGATRLTTLMECLGTKSSIAAGYQAETGTDRFDGEISPDCSASRSLARRGSHV